MKHAPLVVAALILTGCASDPPPPSAAQPSPTTQTAPVAPDAAAAAPALPEPPPAAADERRVVEFAGGLVADLDAGTITFPGRIAWDFADPAHARTYLEAFVCRPDTKEHESLVVTDVEARVVHAALLALGVEPGAPGQILFDEAGVAERVPASGPGIGVEFITSGGETIDPRSWVVHSETGESIAMNSGWVFVGSDERTLNGRVWYAADLDGVVVGLHTFGSATVAYAEAMSPDSHVDTPEWIADGSKIPPFGAPVSVRLRVLGD